MGTMAGGVEAWSVLTDYERRARVLLRCQKKPRPGAENPFQKKVFELELEDW